MAPVAGSCFTALPTPISRLPRHSICVKLPTAGERNETDHKVSVRSNKCCSEATPTPSDPIRSDVRTDALHVVRLDAVLELVLLEVPVLDHLVGCECTVR